MANTILPRLFAIFDDSPAWRENFSERRFCLLRRISGPADSLRLEPYVLPPGVHVTLEVNEYRVQPVAIQHDGFETFWWHTGFSLCYHGQSPERAPSHVVDFLHRDRLPLEYTVTAQNDDDIRCMVRQVDQRCTRTRIEEGHLDFQVNWLSPIPAKAHGDLQVPNFVLEAYLRDAETQGQTCSITCKSPKECSSVSIPNCYHWFETAALELWRKTKNTCPVCKVSITKTIELKQ
jgi:hypothetical protein